MRYRGYLLVCCIMLGVLVLPDSFVYAQSSLTSNVAANEPTTLQAFATIMELLVQFLSRSRVIIAMLAGKVMTNDLVYGSFINLDTVLWQLRNISKNFANFGLGFMFLFQILKYVLNPADQGGEIKKVVLNLVIGGILIQSSRFLVGAAIDLSTIATAAVGAFPSTVLDQNQMFKDSALSLKVGFPRRVELPDLLGDKKISVITGDITTAEYLDMIMPDATNIAGPFIFLGMSVMRFQEYMLIGTENSLANAGASVADFTRASLFFILQFGMIALFTLALLIILIVNVIRILYLWMLIAFSPLMILFKTMADSDDMTNGAIEGAELRELVKLVFSPVVYTGYVSLMMIIVLGLTSIMGMGSPKPTINLPGGTVISTTTNGQNMTNEGVFSITADGAMRGNLLSSTKTSLSDLIVFGFILAMMRGLVSLMAQGKGAAKAGTSFASKAQEIAGQAAMNAPIIPVGGGVGLNAAGKGLSSKFDEIKSGIRANDAAQEKKVSDQLRTRAGMPVPLDYTELDQIAGADATTKNNYNKYFTTSRDLYNSQILKSGTALSQEASLVNKVISQFDVYLNSKQAVEFMQTVALSDENVKKAFVAYRERSKKQKEGDKSLRGFISTKGTDAFDKDRKIVTNTIAKHGLGIATPNFANYDQLLKYKKV